MTRSADYTIQGFLYQFNKTALEILKARDEDMITVEGVVEDIEITSTASLKAIQCKYHEASTSFSPSGIFKPLLQMLKHFSEHEDSDIQYILFAHYPSVKKSSMSDIKDILAMAMKTKDKQLKKLVQTVPNDVDLEAFLSRFTIEIGPSYDELANQVATQLEENGIPAGDIDTLAYPNTVHLVATLSVKHDARHRRITKRQFLSQLNAIRTTAISRWTLSLKTRKKLLDAKRRQLKTQLSKNSRLRYFIIDPAGIEDYESEIVLFISDVLGKYHFKIAHTSTPVLCLCSGREKIQEIQRRLFSKDIIAEDGYIGGVFQESRFFRDPITTKRPGGGLNREFALRVLNWDDHRSVLNNKKCDDLYIIGEKSCSELNTTDVNVEHLAGATMKEIKFVMGVSDVSD